MASKQWQVVLRNSQKLRRVIEWCRFHTRGAQQDLAISCLPSEESTSIDWTVNTISLFLVSVLVYKVKVADIERHITLQGLVVMATVWPPGGADRWVLPSSTSSSCTSFLLAFLKEDTHTPVFPCPLILTWTHQVIHNPGDNQWISQNTHSSSKEKAMPIIYTRSTYMTSVL